MKYKHFDSILTILSLIIVSIILFTRQINELPEIEINFPQIESNYGTTSSDEEIVVTRVIDGDTIEISGGDKIRYIGIDAPESPHNKNAECFAFNSYLKNGEFVLGKKVRLQKDKTDKDRYGRRLRYVYVGDVFINFELVRQGYAVDKEYHPDVKSSTLLKTAQTQAQSDKKGIWGYCYSEENIRADEFIINFLKLNSDKQKIFDFGYE